MVDRGRRMKKTAIRKDFYMEIRKSPGRFLSIFFIVALGVAFFSGIRSAQPSMLATGDYYFDNSQLMDIKAVSTMGLPDTDIQALERVDGVSKVEGGYSLDVISKEEDSQQVLHLMSVLPTMNQITVSEGRMPQKVGECLADSEMGYKVGDEISMESGTDEDIKDSLKTDKLKVVGLGSSPCYISFSRGSTQIGDGSIDGFLIVPERTFDMDVYTEAYIKVDNAEDMVAYSDAYEDEIDRVLDNVEAITGERARLRKTDIKEEAQEEIDKAKGELADGRREAKEELDKAAKKLADGERQLNDGKRQLADGESAIFKAKATLNDKQQELNDAKSQYNAGKRQFDEGKAAYQNGLAEYGKQKAEYGPLIEQGRNQLAEGRKTLDEQWVQYQGMQAQYDDLSGQYSAMNGQYNALDAQHQELQTQIDSMDPATEGYEEQIAELQRQQAEIKGQQAAIEGQMSGVQAGMQQLEAGMAQMKQGLDKAEQEYTANSATLEGYQAALDQGAETLNQSKAQLDASESQLSGAWTQIESGQAQINSGFDEIKSQEAKLSDAKAELAGKEPELADGKREYEKAKKDAEAEISDGEKKIRDAEKDISEIKNPKWYVFDRGTLPEHVGYGENADRMKAIGEVFPVLFFLVAALISLTSMTRMVEEQRIQIGTLKALGYGKAPIAAKYLGYAFIATMGGSIAGVLVGEKVLPYIIIYSYGMMYHHMPDILVPYDWGYAVMATGAALVCTMVATCLSCYKELSATPAVLMRPPSPKKGKRVLLERIPIIWKHLSFIWKSTIRNLLRYKKRFFMTLFGISGCMALILIGFGLKDSIREIAGLQYGGIQTYDGMAYRNEDAAADEKKELEKVLGDESRIEDYIDTYMQTIILVKGDKERETYLCVPDDARRIEDFISFHDRITKEPYDLTEEGVIISEKTAKMLDAEAGDTVAIKDTDLGNRDVKIVDICENYMGHYIYMTEGYYEQLYSEQPEFNNILFKTPGDSKDELVETGEELLALKAVMNITYLTDVEKQLRDMLETLNLVIVVLITSAGMLAFVVLYNLNNINITERKRELATIKVLGFYDMEVAAYVYRENVVLTLVGAIGGVGLGMLLHRFIIQTVEVDAVMFGRDIHPSSYIYSIALTFVFSAIVNWVMYFKLKRIDMVESLKSVE